MIRNVSIFLKHVFPLLSFTIQKLNPLLIIFHHNCTFHPCFSFVQRRFAENPNFRYPNVTYIEVLGSLTREWVGDWDDQLLSQSHYYWVLFKDAVLLPWFLLIFQVLEGHAPLFLDHSLKILIWEDGRGCSSRRSRPRSWTLSGFKKKKKFMTIQ